MKAAWSTRGDGPDPGPLRGTGKQARRAWDAARNRRAAGGRAYKRREGVPAPAGIATALPSADSWGLISRTNHGQMIKGPTAAVGDQASDLRLLGYGGPIYALATTELVTVPIDAVLWLDDESALEY